jgi:hypothetical protein
MNISTAPSSSIETANQTYRVQRTLLSLRKSNPSSQAPSSKLLSYPSFSGLRNKFPSANRKPAVGKTALRIFTEMSDANQFFIPSNKVTCSKDDDYISYIVYNSNRTVTTMLRLQRHLQQLFCELSRPPFVTTYQTNLQLPNDVHNEVALRHPGPTFVLFIDGCSKLWTVGLYYTIHSHHIHTSLGNIWMYEYQSRYRLSVATFHLVLGSKLCFGWLFLSSKKCFNRR